MIFLVDRLVRVCLDRNWTCGWMDGRYLQVGGRCGVVDTNLTDWTELGHRADREQMAGKRKNSTASQPVRGPTLVDVDSTLTLPTYLPSLEVM